MWNFGLGTSFGLWHQEQQFKVTFLSLRDYLLSQMHPNYTEPDVHEVVQTSLWATELELSHSPCCCLKVSVRALSGEERGKGGGSSYCPGKDYRCSSESLCFYFWAVELSRGTPYCLKPLDKIQNGESLTTFFLDFFLTLTSRECALWAPDL